MRKNAREMIDMTVNERIEKRLFALKDEGYKNFHGKLMPNIDTNTIIGVRMPLVKKMAKELCGTDDSLEFLNLLPHRYYEENNLHALLICGIKDFEKCIFALEKFLPYVDNWATCDCMRPRCFAENRDKLLPFIDKWLMSSHTYTVRFAVEMLMIHYLEVENVTVYADRVAAVKSEEYYVNMMIAWYFATAMAVRWEAAVKYIENKRLPLRVHNKAIQKALESYRISADKKEYLKGLKIR